LQKIAFTLFNLQIKEDFSFKIELLVHIHELLQELFDLQIEELIFVIILEEVLSLYPHFVQIKLEQKFMEVKRDLLE